MTQMLPPAIGAEQRVTASDLVRHFGSWQERATRAPVYVLHRGRPRFALIALDLMEALCAPHSADGAGDEHQRDAIVDAMPDMLLLVDDAGRIACASAPARARFGVAARIGSPASALSQRSGGFLADALARVLAGGSAEEVDLLADRHPDRRLACTVSPLPQGALVLVRDPSAAEELRAAHAAGRAQADALALTGACATARIGLRGHISAADATLTTLTGVAAEQLVQARFVTLIAIADRPRAGAALEEAALGQATRLEAGLLVRGAQERRVAIGLSPVQVRGRVEEIAVAIATL